jgi:hypothetical protein
MHKLPLAAISVAILAGCATAPQQQPKVSTYSYESKVHSGTVNVTDKLYSSDSFTCPAMWRDGELYTPKGLPDMGHDHLNVSINLQADSGEVQSFAFDIPQDLGNRVYARDFQVPKNYMLGTESNGLVQQGEHFFYPEGYYIRVSEPSVQGWNFVSCIGIDHMYVMAADLQNSTNPPIHLDRVVIPFAMDDENQPVKISFGSGVQHTAEIRVQP